MNSHAMDAREVDMPKRALPVIDLGPFLKGEAGALDQLSKEWREVCEKLGFLCVINHGIPDELIAEMEAATRAFHALADEAVVRTVRRLNPRSLKTCRVPVIFSAEVARGLIGHFISAISGGALYRRASFLAGKLDKLVFPQWMNLSEAPHLLTALGSQPFDSDGVATSAKHFIDQGRLMNYALGVYSARKLAMQTTGNADGVHNLIVSPGSDNLAALLKKMQRGLLITELMGQGVDIITGNYSRGAAGFWIENGEIGYPVHQITVAGNLNDMFATIVAVGNDVDVRGNIRTGSILLDNLTIAGQ